MNQDFSLNQNLFSEIKALIEDGRQQVAVTVNAAMIMVWSTGRSGSGSVRRLPSHLPQ